MGRSYLFAIKNYRIFTHTHEDQNREQVCTIKTTSIDAKKLKRKHSDEEQFIRNNPPHHGPG